MIEIEIFYNAAFVMSIRENQTKIVVFRKLHTKILTASTRYRNYNRARLLTKSERFFSVS